MATNCFLLRALAVHHLTRLDLIGKNEKRHDGTIRRAEEEIHRLLKEMPRWEGLVGDWGLCYESDQRKFRLYNFLNLKPKDCNTQIKFTAVVEASFLCNFTVKIEGPFGHHQGLKRRVGERVKDGLNKKVELFGGLGD